MTFADMFDVGFRVITASVILFLVIEVAFGQWVADTFTNSEHWVAFLLTIAGLFLAFACSIVVGLIAIDNLSKVYILYATLITFFVNLGLWIVVAYIYIFVFATPESLNNLNPLEFILALPQVLTFFAAIAFGNISYFWLASIITYGLMLPIFLKVLGARRKSKKVRIKYPKR